MICSWSAAGNELNEIQAPALTWISFWNDTCAPLTLLRASVFMPLSYQGKRRPGKGVGFLCSTRVVLGLARTIASADTLRILGYPGERDTAKLPILPGPRAGRAAPRPIY